MSEIETGPPESIPCNECLAGMMSPRLITYFTWLGEDLITVPNFPAWVCDICGKREYDEKAVAWLNMLLAPNAGKPTPHQRHTPPPARPQTSAPPSISES